MLWIALATAIVLLSGEGDGFEMYRETVSALREGLTAAVSDEWRRQEALEAVDRLEATVVDHWSGVQSAGDCIERADRAYAATLDDYERCIAEMDAVLERTHARYVEARMGLERAVPEAAWPAIGSAVAEALE